MQLEWPALHYASRVAGGTRERSRRGLQPRWPAPATRAPTDGALNISSPAEPLNVRIPDDRPRPCWDMRAVDSPAPPRVWGQTQAGPATSSVRGGSPDSRRHRVVHLWNLSTPSPLTILFATRENGGRSSARTAVDGDGAPASNSQTRDLKSPGPSERSAHSSGHRHDPRPRLQRE